MVRQSGLGKNLELGVVLPMLPIAVQSRGRGTSARKNEHWDMVVMPRRAGGGHGCSTKLVLPGALGATPG